MAALLRSANKLTPLPSWERGWSEGAVGAVADHGRPPASLRGPSPLSPLPRGERGNRLAAIVRRPPPPEEEGRPSANTPLPLPDPDLPSLVGPAGWARLKPAVRRRFACGHGAHPIAYEGRMRVERSAAGVVFALLAKLFGGPLPLRAYPDAGACVEVFADGRGGVVWRRELRFSPTAAPVVVRSTKRRDQRGDLLECVDGGLGMRLAVFEDRGALVFESRSFFLRVASVKLPIPALAAPGVCRVVHTDEGGGRFRFTMTFTHPLFGRTFVQDGLFLDPEHNAPMEA